MGLFRCETALDEKSGRYWVEVYYPEDAVEPLVATAPIYPTPEIAEADMVEIFRKWAGKAKVASRPPSS